MFGMVSRPGRYDRMTSGPFRGVHARVVADVSAARLGSGARVLDVGTGPGGVPLEIAWAQPLLRVDGLDLRRRHDRLRTNSDPPMPDSPTASRSPSATSHTCPTRTRRFDLVVSSMSQHHWRDVPAGIREVRRVLRPGGRAWIYDARIALHRATSAARRHAGPRGASVAPVRTSRLPVRLVGRLEIATTPATVRGVDPTHRTDRLQGQHGSDLVPTLRSGPGDERAGERPPHARASPVPRILGDRPCGP